MNTTMRTHKVTKLQAVGVSTAVLALVGTGGYVLAASDIFSPAVASANSSSNTWGGHGNASQTALVIDAVEYYQNTKGVTSDSYQVYNVDTQGDSARGKIDNPDSGSVFYATKTDGKWNVVIAGQTALTQELAAANNLPSNWVGKTDW